MAEHDVTIRELAQLLCVSKSVVARVVTGQFVRVDPDFQRRLSRVTNRAIDSEEWSAFLQRRLEARCAA